MAEILNNLYSFEIKSFDNSTTFTSDKEKRSALVSDQVADIKISVLDMNYIKEMYRPGHLTLKLSATEIKSNTSGSLTFDRIIALFTKAQVTVSVKRDDDKAVSGTKTTGADSGSDNTISTIISKYYVMSVEPIRKPNCSYEVILEAYSPDYQLTSDKYCDTYLNTPLNSIISSGIDKVKEASPDTSSKNVSGIRKNMLDISFSCNKKDGLKFINYEHASDDYRVYHTPYAVQYNESFYDFVTRLANRYGEFLYFEDGSLHLGIDTTKTQETNIHDISADNDNPGFKSVSQMKQADSLTIDQKIIASHYDYLNTEVSDSEKLENTFNYDLDYATDMYMDSVNKEDLSKDDNRFSYYFNWVGLLGKTIKNLTMFRLEDGITNKLGTIANNITAVVAKAAVDVVDTCLKAQGNVDKYNKQYNKLIGELKGLSQYVSEEQEGDNSLCPFASIRKSDEAAIEELKKDRKTYNEANVQRKEVDNKIDENNQLPNAEEKYDDLLTQSAALEKEFSEFDKKVVTDKTEVDNKLAQASTISQKAKANYAQTSDSCKALISQAMTKLDNVIQTCRKTGNDASTDEISTLIDNALSLIDALKKEADYDKIALSKTFKNRKDNELIEGEPGQKERNAFSNKVDELFTKLNNDLNEVKSALENTKKELASIVENAKKLNELDKKEQDAWDTLLACFKKIFNNNLFHNVLESIENLETQIGRKRICLEIDTANYKKVPLLGEIVKFDGINYLIIKVESQVSLSNQSGTSYNEVLKLELIPMFKKPDSDEQLWVPTLNSCRYQPKVGAMVAVVTDNIDPVGIGRLRIKYKWQKKDDTNSSPWIRMAVPYASKRGAGMFFIPNKGDEVLVDFYNGNIDRPIIAGVLRNTGDERDTDMSYRWEKRREIMSATGQILAFKENGDYAFSSLGVECIPGLSTYGLAYDPNLAYLNTFFDELDEKNGFAKYMRGSLGMSDFYGTWNISGDTGGREVSISSSLGTISIDALNGISISAPLGDISISAKNISLEASNNINIQSGTQIARQRKIKKTFKDGSAAGIYNTLKGVAKSKCTLVKVDFSLLRMVVEAIIPPVEGSLTLKSNRYLKLEAGEKAKAVDEARVDKFELGKYDDSKALIGKGISTLFGINKHNDLHEFIFANRAALLSFNTAINAVPAIIKNLCSDRRRARQNIKGNKIYEEAQNNGFELNALDGSLWGDLGKVETIGDLNAKTSEQIDTYLKAIINGANDDRIKTIFENPASGTLDEALNSIGLSTAGTEDEKKARLLEPNKRRFVKMAWSAAHTAFENASAAAKENFTNKVKDDLTAAMPMNSDKTIIPQYNVPAKEIKKAEWETLFKTIGEAIWNLKEDGTDLPSERFGEESFENSIIRIILLKIFNETGWYVYDKEYAKEQFSFLQATKDVFGKGVQVPESNFVAATAALDLDYFADGHHEADWSTFQKSCKFMSEAWENPPKKHTSGLSLISTLASEPADVLSISDVFDEVTSIIGGSIYESTHIKSSTHGGRILMSNGEESWALKNDTGQLEQTSFDIGDKTWN